LNLLFGVLMKQNFEARFKSIPNITELDHLTVSRFLTLGTNALLTI
jgi:hypothetical protein